MDPQLPAAKLTMTAASNRFIRRIRICSPASIKCAKAADYSPRKKLDSFFPEIPVLFTVTRTNEKLHIPLLLSQYGYSTYKGS